MSKFEKYHKFFPELPPFILKELTADEFHGMMETATTAMQAHIQEQMQNPSTSGTINLPP